MGHLGYTEGTDKDVATHEIDLGGPRPEHFQRFSTGAGQCRLLNAVPCSSVPVISELFNCKGAGRLIVSPLVAAVDVEMQIVFYDANQIEMGASDILKFETLGPAALTNINTTLAINNPVDALELVKDAGNQYVWQNVRMVDGAYSGGTTGASLPTLSTVVGSETVDGNVVWKNIGNCYSNMFTVPLTVFSNSMGASSFKVNVNTVVSGSVSIFIGVV